MLELIIAVIIGVTLLPLLEGFFWGFIFAFFNALIK